MFVDTSYYFVLDTDGTDDGPYRLTEIQRRIHIGLLSRQATLCKCGETAYVPVTDPRYAAVLEPPPVEEKKPRAAAGTTPPPVDPVAALAAELFAPVAQPASTMSAQ